MCNKLYFFRHFSLNSPHAPVSDEISTPALSLLEGQKRPVMDYELNALADILNVSVDWLLGREEM